MSAGKTSIRNDALRAYRFAVAARALLAVFGGYAVAALANAWLALILPMARAEAVSAATLVSFAIMAGAVIWAFAARTVGRAVLVLGFVATLLTMALWVAGGFQVGAAA